MIRWFNEYFHLKFNSPTKDCFNLHQKHHSAPAPDVSFFTWGSRFPKWLWLNWWKCIMICLLLIRILPFAGRLHLEVAGTLSTTTNQHQPAQSLQHQLSLLRMSTTWQNFVALCPCFNDSIGKNIRPEIRSQTCVSSRHKLGHGFDNFSRQWML